jgi:hypothetical protein
MTILYIVNYRINFYNFIRDSLNVSNDLIEMHLFPIKKTYVDKNLHSFWRCLDTVINSMFYIINI